ncbi:MAG: cytochrome c [Verrucomicrobia bacterium]|nr:cytochrome c [Verrucomicrobiota bacterium]
MVAAPLVSSCEIRQEMWNQPKYEPYEVCDFFGDRLSARPLVEDSVARGQLDIDDVFHTGLTESGFVTEFPLEVTPELLARGRERYDIYCSMCHDKTGSGKGMVVQRGYKQPPSYHSDRLRNDLPIGYFYTVIKNGFGVMPAYGYQIKAEDRWAIVAYVRTLQVSHHANIDVLPEALQEKLGGLE